MILKPTGYRLLVELHQKETSKGGVLIPETVEDSRPMMGQILAAGAKATDVTVGQKIIFPRESGVDVEQDGKACRLVDVRALIAVAE